MDYKKQGLEEFTEKLSYLLHLDKYVDSQGEDITHIYSYNKVMSVADRRGISKILNRTNFRIMAWYFGPRDSSASGLKRVKLAY